MSTTRLVLFQYPLAALQEHFEETADATVVPVAVHDFVAIELKNLKRVQVAKVLRVFEVGQQVEVNIFETPSGRRYRPWGPPWHSLGKHVVIPCVEFFAQLTGLIKP